MRSKPPWGVSVLTLILAAQPVMMASANAQQTAVSTTVANWSNPGSFPFKGDFSDVCKLYAHVLTDEQCLRALSQYETDTAQQSSTDMLGTVIYLQDGDILQVSFTVNGVHQQKTLRVAFGAAVPSDDPMRRAVVYNTGRPDGVKLVRPDVCGNWSVMTVPSAPPAPPEPVIVTRVIYGPREVCEIPEAFTLVTPGQYVPGLDEHPDGCGCGLHVPGMFVGGETVATYGSPICYTISESTEEGN